MTTFALASRGPVSGFARRMPKTELHLHLEGTMEPGLKIALAARHGITLSPAGEAEIRAQYAAHHDLPSFLAVHYANQEVLRDADDFDRLASHYLEVAASNNVRHAEMFFDPQLHTARGVPFGEVIAGYRRALLRAEERFGMTGGLVMCFLRDRGAEYAMATLMEALDHREAITGVGLDSDERGHPPAEFAAVFARARREGFFVTAHCDVDQPGTLEHLRQAMFDIRVDRIDHGVNVIDDPQLLAHAVEAKLGFTVCPLPYGTHVVGFEHEIRRVREMIDRGLRVSLGSDDPPYFGGYLSDNVQACLDHGFSRETMIELQRNAVRSAWISASRRAELLAELDAFAAAELGSAGPGVPGADDDEAAKEKNR